MTQPTPEQIEARAFRANKATRGAMAGVLALEGVVVLLVPRALAQTSTGLGGTKTGLLIALALALITTGFLLRRPWGIGLGSALHVPLLLAGLWIHIFFLIAAIFAGIWIYLCSLRHELVGTPGGVRMLLR